MLVLLILLGSKVVATFFFIFNFILDHSVVKTKKT